MYGASPHQGKLSELRPHEALILPKGKNMQTRNEKNKESEKKVKRKWTQMASVAISYSNHHTLPGLSKPPL